jgi:hypothetical protein
MGFDKLSTIADNRPKRQRFTQIVAGEETLELVENG